VFIISLVRHHHQTLLHRHALNPSDRGPLVAAFHGVFHSSLNPLKGRNVNWLHFAIHAGLTYHFLISDIRALWRSALSARVPECQKLKNDRLYLDGAEQFLM